MMRYISALVLLLAAITAAGCGDGKAVQPTSTDAPKAIAVNTTAVTARQVQADFQETGTFVADESSDVAPMVAGRVVSTPVNAGDRVRQGQVICELDHRDAQLKLDQARAQLEEATASLRQAQSRIGWSQGTFDPNKVPEVAAARANYESAQAQANLQSARASAEAARTLASRYKPLVQMQAISKQDYTNAVAQARQADASVAQNSAALRTAQINLHYTRVPAPISGRIGLSNVTEGALVTANQTDAMTTITRLDPVFVDIQESAADLLSLRKALSRGGVVSTTAQVRLKLADGSDYGYTGTVEFSQVLVDQSTGTVTLRARFPNSQSILLPGMFVTAQFAQAIDTSAILVPQQAVTRDPKGNATLWVVGPGNRAVERTIVADRTQGEYWVVTQGLAPGEKVITQGTANLKDGAPIKPVPASAPQKVKAPPPGAMKGGRGSAHGG